MNTLTDEQLEQIDQYLAAELKDEQRAQVTNLISNDPLWKAEYQLRLAARTASKNIFHHTMRERFRQMDAVPARRRTLSPLWLAAAACLAAIVSALLWFYPAKDSNAFLAEYKAFPNVEVPIEKSGGDFTNREQAYHAYELTEYEKAFSLFSQLDTVQTVDRLYLGLSYLEAGKYTEANSILDEVRASSNPRWSEVADWYLAWSHLKRDNHAEAKQILTQITRSPQHRYSTQATELLARLK